MKLLAVLAALVALWFPLQMGGLALVYVAYLAYRADDRDAARYVMLHTRVYGEPPDES